MRQANIPVAVALLASVLLGAGAEPPGLTKVYEAAGVAVEAGFAPDQGETILGQPLFITFTVTNRGDRAYHFYAGGDNRGSVRHNNFHITAADADGKPVKDPCSYDNHGGFCQDIALEKDKSYTERLFLWHWCDFEKPGTYTVTCKRTLRDIEKEPRSPPVAVETSFTLTVLPYDKRAMGKVIDRLAARIGGDKDALYEASLGLASIKDERTIAPLAAAVAKGGYQNQIPAIEGLLQYATDAAADALMPCLKDADHAVRQRAGAALVKMQKGDRLVSFLLEDMKSQSPDDRISAVRGLGATRAAEAFAPLVRLLGDPERRVRHAAAGALGALGEAKAVGILKDRLNDPDMLMRVSIVKGLLALKEPLDVEWLALAVAQAGAGDESFHESIRLVRLCGGEKAVRALASCLHFDDPSVRASHNMYLVLAIEQSPNGPKHYYQWKHDPNRDGTPEEIAGNRKILDALKAWLKEQP